MNFGPKQAIYHREIHVDSVSLTGPKLSAPGCVCVRALVCVLLLTHYICLVVTKIITSLTHTEPCHPLCADATVITEC